MTQTRANGPESLEMEMNHQKDSRSIEAALMAAPSIPEPVYVEDDPPTADELDENLAPTLVEIHGFRGYGDDCDETVWTVEANASGPAWSLVE